MSGNEHEAIIHTIDPVAIIEVLQGHIDFPAGTYYQHFTEGLDEVTFRVHHLFTTQLDGEQHEAIVRKLLTRAWNWYKALNDYYDSK